MLRAPPAAHRALLRARPHPGVGIRAGAGHVAVAEERHIPHTAWVLNALQALACLRLPQLQAVVFAARGNEAVSSCSHAVDERCVAVQSLEALALRAPQPDGGVVGGRQQAHVGQHG